MKTHFFGPSIAALILASSILTFANTASADPGDRPETEEQAPRQQRHENSVRPQPRPENRPFVPQSAPAPAVPYSAPIMRQESAPSEPRNRPLHPRFTGRSEPRAVETNANPRPDYQPRAIEPTPPQVNQAPAPQSPPMFNRDRGNDRNADRGRRNSPDDSQNRNSNSRHYGNDDSQNPMRQRQEYENRRGQNSNYGHNRSPQNGSARNNDWQNDNSRHSSSRHNSTGHNQNSYHYQHRDNSRSRTNWYFGPTYNWQFSRGNGWQSYNQPRYSAGSYNYYSNNNPRFDFRSHAGRHFMGPYGNWSRWDNNWGDANIWARRWGFERYDPYRGWYRNNIWYSHPSQWDGWGGWFSFFMGSSGVWGYSYDNYSNTQYYDYYDQYGQDCLRLSIREFIQSQAAVTSFIACQNTWGNWVEVPNTRQFEYWDY